MTKTIPYLDGWRGLAIVLVLQSHFGLGGGGRLGVTLFFALSGYLMGELLFVKNVSLPSFFKRRISRIMPTYWLYLIAAAAFALWYQPNSYSVPLYEWMSTLLFTRTYFPLNESLWANKWPIGHFWSLNVEEHSYIYLALLAVVARGARLSWMLMATIAGSLLCIIYYTFHPPIAASPWIARSECAALGLIASATLRVIRHQTQRPVVRNGVVWLTPVTLALAVICSTLSAQPLFSIVLTPLLLAVSINYLERSPALLREFLSTRILCWFGVCSFSLYVWQQLFYVAYEHGVMQRQVAGVLSILVGAVAFYLFENPARLYLNSFKVRKARQETTPAGSTETIIAKLDLAKDEVVEQDLNYRSAI